MQHTNLKLLDKYKYIPKKIKALSDKELEKEYIEQGLNNEADTFILYRVIGNDLPPRHELGQSYKNVKFILEHEPDFKGCQKKWVLNRIINLDEKNKIINLLETKKQDYLDIPFLQDEYINQDWDFESFPVPEFLHSDQIKKTNESVISTALDQLYRHKNNYVMNNNGARNTALRDGKKHCKWVLPWDGNCFLTEGAWLSIKDTITQKPFLKYFIVPMARVLDNDELLGNDFVPNAVEEPQIIFRKDTQEEFNEEYRYGRRPKVEMLWRLGVPGPWDSWKNYCWDQPFPDLSDDAGQFESAGWVARLFSGTAKLENDDRKSFVDRGIARQKAITEFLDDLDASILGEYTSETDCLTLNLQRLNEQKDLLKHGDQRLKEIVKILEIDAEAALKRQLPSVTNKTTLPPSGDIHDYWHPAPYWWPNPNSSNGLPFIRKDGERVDGTILYGEGCEKYDRTSVQYLFDDVTILALAEFFTDKKKYSKHAAEIVKTWFLNQSTRMNPHLTYSQVRMGHNENKGASTGIIEFKDVYYMLDAIKLLTMSGSIGPKTEVKLKDWFQKYLDWLLTSDQGKGECRALNNHGILYDLQVMSIAHYVGNWTEVNLAIRRAKDRIGGHFTADGKQPHEMTRTLTQHYCAFNLQSWCNFAKAAESIDQDIWYYIHPAGMSIENGVEWFLKYYGQDWNYQQIESFDDERFIPIHKAYCETYPFPDTELSSRISINYLEVKPRFWPHDGIRPYWEFRIIFVIGTCFNYE